MNEILRDHDRVLSDPAPEVNVTTLADSAVVLQVLSWIDGPRGTQRGRDHVCRHTVCRHTLSPFPQQVVHLHDTTKNRQSAPSPSDSEDLPSPLERGPSQFQ